MDNLTVFIIHILQVATYKWMQKARPSPSFAGRPDASPAQQGKLCECATSVDDDGDTASEGGHTEPYDDSDALMCSVCMAGFVLITLCSVLPQNRTLSGEHVHPVHKYPDYPLNIP